MAHHRRTHVLVDEEGAEQVDGDDPTEGLGVDLLGSDHPLRDAGGAHKPAGHEAGRLDRLDDGEDAALFGDIAAPPWHPNARGLLHHRAGQVEQRDLVAALDEQLRARGADAGRRAGDDDGVGRHQRVSISNCGS